MSEKVAVIASILKPVDDTRMYEKLALSISETKKYRVNIIGFEVKNPPAVHGIEFHSIYSGNRLGWTRLLVPWRFLLKLVTLTPKLLIVCTPELLFPAVIYKLIFKTRLWYDVQENYQKNVQYQSAYPRMLKPLLKLAVKMAENGSGRFIDHYLLAEQGYLKELKFINGNSTVLENKFRSLNVISGTAANNNPVKLVYTGTCSRENGILEAIALWESLYCMQFPVRLDIVGQIPDLRLLRFVQEKVKNYPGQLNLLGNGSLVPHSLIMKHATRANFGLVAHQPNPSTENCIPTKIYEYLGLRLPMILQSHPLWESVVASYSAAVVLDFNRFHPHGVWKKLHETKFYTTLPGPEISWESEEQKLIALLS